MLCAYSRAGRRRKDLNQAGNTFSSPLRLAMTAFVSEEQDVIVHSSILPSRLKIISKAWHTVAGSSFFD